MIDTFLKGTKAPSEGLAFAGFEEGNHCAFYRKPRESKGGALSGPISNKTTAR